MKQLSKLGQKQRAAKIVALLTAGLSKSEIAKQLGISRQTIYDDIADLKPAVAEAQTVLERAQTRLREIMPIEQRIDELPKILELAKTTKQPAAALQVLAHANAIDGLITEGERLKHEKDAPVASGPMFVLPEGAHVAVTINQQNNTISSERGSLHNTPSVTEHNDTTTSSNDE